jgi:UDP-2-acetamido-2,6-beta-L-arabino-hexul-4-ose reductase
MTSIRERRHDATLETPMNILITGAGGFIGRNLVAHLGTTPDMVAIPAGRDTSAQDLASYVATADFICHLAGVNRPTDDREFDSGNRELTARLCDMAAATGRKIPLIISSSVHAERPTPYGSSKLAAEQAARNYGKQTGAPVHVFRLPNVFGKWCRPNYNSAVATFCHNIANDLPISVSDPAAPLTLVYVDDVVRAFTAIFSGGSDTEVTPAYTTTVGEVASVVQGFRDTRQTHTVGSTGVGLVRALYATYLSYLKPDQFSYPLTRHADARGVFVEFLKTAASGQFSFFTALPGITRGGHYHHTKNEKFLVVRGRAAFRFRHILTGDTYELTTTAEAPMVVETVPGWAHDITNVGDEEMIVMLWANEIFDRERPDTFTAPLLPAS